jgi:hypothetical protein
MLPTVLLQAPPQTLTSVVTYVGSVRYLGRTAPTLVNITVC